MSDAVQTKKRPGRPKKVKVEEEDAPVNDIVTRLEQVTNVDAPAVINPTCKIRRSAKKSKPNSEEVKEEVPDTKSIASSTTEKPTCPICCEHFTQQLRKPICCPKCSTETCAVCTKRYLLDLIDDPHCMSCKFGWTRSFLNDNLSNAFMNGDWLDHRQQILWRREEAYLPEAQLVAERITKGRSLRKSLEPIELERQKILKQLAKIEADYNIAMRKIHRLEAGQDDTMQSVTTEPEKKERKEFIRRCPHDNCKGFLSSAWKCGLCENYTCKDCLIVKGKDRDADHTCSKDDLATAQLIAKDTKFCPNPQCGIGIMRTEGCSQMFCTSCKTAFDWNSMRIITSGHIHNPHYFAYMQANGNQVNRTAGDMMCGGLPPPNIIAPARGYPVLPWMMTAETMYQAIGHMFDTIGPRYNAHIREEDNRDYRVKYLLNDMRKQDIERILVIQERRRERERSIREVIDTFANMGAEIFRRFATETKRDATTWEPYSKELQGLRNYCNEEFIKLSKQYKVVVPFIVERVITYTPKGNVMGWTVHTENTPKIASLNDTTASETAAMAVYHQHLKIVKDFDCESKIKRFRELIEDPEAKFSSAEDTLLTTTLSEYNKLRDKLHTIGDTDLKAALQTKFDYFLHYYNSVWTKYKLEKWINDWKPLENPTTLTNANKTSLQNSLTNTVSAMKKSGIINAHIPEIVALFKAHVPRTTELQIELHNFEYIVETQKKRSQNIVKAYVDLDPSLK
jgi:hypothetical protein